MTYRVAIIGHTGRGSYGHYLDQSFVGVEGASTPRVPVWSVGSVGLCIRLSLRCVSAVATPCGHTTTQ